jgi:formylmethanofuran--tetrahydromethanopterin N-formyltransferase
MYIGNVFIEDTFAEAFPMYATRFLITAENKKWALIAAREATGFATSIIMSPAEGGIEKVVSPSTTPDGRIGCLVQLYHRDPMNLKFQVLARVGQCILTCPTTAAFDGLPKVRRRMKVGGAISKFGDGFEKEDALNGRKIWRIPVMEGEFIVEDSFGVLKGVAGGNILILAKTHSAGLEAAEKSIKAIFKYGKHVITPFPGGIVRSGSKVGSLKYSRLGASTNHYYCPTLKDIVEDTRLPPEVNSVLEIVINGLTLEDVQEAMGIAIKAAASVDGVVKIDAGNYGGRLGPYHIRLHESIEKVKNMNIDV